MDIVDLQEATNDYMNLEAEGHQAGSRIGLSTHERRLHPDDGIIRDPAADSRG